MIISNECMDFNDPKEFDDPQLFDDPRPFDDPQLFDDQLEIWTLIIQKSTVIPSSPMVLLTLWVIALSKKTSFGQIYSCSIINRTLPLNFARHKNALLTHLTYSAM